MSPTDKPLLWLHGEVKTPPLSEAARCEAGRLLRRLQRGESLGMPHSRPLPSIGARCHEIRITDCSRAWRIVYRIDAEAIIVAEVFEKKTQKLPGAVIEACRKRLAKLDAILKGKERAR